MMKISKYIVVTILTVATFRPAGVLAASSEEISELYNKAIKAFQKEDYRNAISYWEEILDIDPDQKPPKSMIKLALKRIREEIKPLEDKADSSVEDGKYAKARKEYMKILALAPGEETVTEKAARLEKIYMITEDISGKARAKKMARSGVSSYVIDYKGKASLLKLIYAKQLNSSSSLDKRIKKIIDEVARDFRGIYSNIEIVEGMTLLEQYLKQALEHIYNEDYLQAIDSCKNVLILDKNNTVAMMRMGSSYYGLDKVDQAEYYWEQVLKYDPDNSDVKKFLNAIKSRR